MAIQDQGLNSPPTSVGVHRSIDNGSRALSAIATLLSLLAVLGTGYTLFQISQLREENRQLRNSISSILNSQNQPSLTTQGSNGATATYSQVTPTVTATTPAVVTSPSPNTTITPPPTVNTAIQPGQFVQPAFSNKAQVELLKVNRIPGQRDVVNVQVRFRLLRPQTTVGSDSIFIGGTTARNPNTSETYQAVNGESTGSVSLFSMRLANQTSADAYVWLQVPEGVNTIDIYVPNTQAFQNVPISS